MNEETSLNIVQSGGDTLNGHAPIFSADGKLLFCTCASEVKVFSTETGVCVQRLIGHDDVVTGIALHPSIKLQAITSSLDGTIRTWDYEDGILLKTCHVGNPLSRVYADPSNEKYILFVTKGHDVGNLLRLPIEKLACGDVENDPELVVLAKDVTRKMAKAAGFLLEGKYAVYCKGKKKICVQSLQNENLYIEHENKKDGKIASIACHPTENCVATGHTSGIIKFWHNVCPKKGRVQKPVISHVHWHYTCVQDIAFTPGGASLLSIGGESVLVQWQYRQQGDQKNVFPRLGGQARHIAISSDSTLYATTLRDNAVLIITNNFKIKHTIEGFTAAQYLLSETDKVKMLEYDWKTRSCATIGKPGHLLFYRPHADIQLYNLDITHKNYISGNPAANDRQSIITHVTFSHLPKIKVSKDDPENCTWMATVEEVPDTDSSLVQDRKLKFWVFDETQQWWKLSTVINDPHKDSVTRIVFRPHCDTDAGVPSLLSTGLDGVAKIWEITNTTGTESSVFWNCMDATSYRRQIAYDGDFSQDGSLVAVAFSHAVCISNPDALHEMSLLFSFAKDETIKRLSFGLSSCQHMLMMMLENSLHSFDLLIGNIAWTVDLKIEHFIRDPLSEVMAVLSESRDLYIFKPSSSLPLYMHKNVCENDILSVAFVPNVKDEKTWLGNGSEVSWMRHSRLFFVEKKMSVFTICTDGELDMKRRMSTVTSSLVSNAESLKTPLASVLQKQSTEEDFAQEEKSFTELTRQSQITALKKITDTPVHVLPPMSSLCKDFVMAFIPKKRSHLGETGGSDDDVRMEVDGDGNSMAVTNKDNSPQIPSLDELLSKIDLDKIANRDLDFVADIWI